MKIIKHVPIISNGPIQSGIVTNHQDHVIVFVSFNTRNTKNSAVVKLIPPDVTDLLILFFPPDCTAHNTAHE